MTSNLLLFLFFVNLNSQEKKPIENARINFLYEINYRENSAYLTFNSRWDFDDAKKIYFIPLSIYKSAKQIDLSRDMKFKYYGYGIKPFKIINIQRLSKIKPDISGSGNISSQDDNSQVGNRSATGSKRKRGLISLSPLYEDITENVYDFILENSIKPLIPQWSSVSKEGKKEFFTDIYSTGLFDNFLLMPIGDALYEISSRRYSNEKKTQIRQ